MKVSVLIRKWFTVYFTKWKILNISFPQYANVLLRLPKLRVQNGNKAEHLSTTLISFLFSSPSSWGLSNHQSCHQSLHRVPSTMATLASPHLNKPPTNVYVPATYMYMSKPYIYLGWWYQRSTMLQDPEMWIQVYRSGWNSTWVEFWQLWYLLV